MTSLVGEIRAAVRKDAAVAVIPSVARPTAGAWYEGSDLAGARREPPASSRLASTSRARRACGPTSWTSSAGSAARGKLRGILRPAYPDLTSARRSPGGGRRRLRDGGVADIAFYN